MVTWEDGLSEDEAATLGLWNNPAYQELLADLHITQADVIQSHQLTNPEISTMFPLGVKQWEFTLMVPLDVLVLRPRRVVAAQLESQRVAERLVQDGLNVVRDVRWAYVDLVLAKGLFRLAEEGLQLRSQITRIAEARVQAGAVAELDVSAIRLDALFSGEEVARTARGVDLAREQLRFLLGLASTGIPVEVMALEEVPPVELRVEELVSEAVASRPDLRALKLALAAACERARLARYDYFNVSGALPDINSQGRKGFEAGPGLRLSIPVFNRNQGAIARAEAEVARLQRQYTRLQDTIVLEVRQAHTRLLQAQQDSRIWREQVLPQADQAVASAEKALEEDGVSLLLVLETTRQLLDARQRALQAAADCHRAVAELERSVGRRVFGRPPTHQDGEQLLPPNLQPRVEEPTP
jgi:cobalt-zinc-cadmium efflux system outer membrane protein